MGGAGAALGSGVGKDAYIGVPAKGTSLATLGGTGGDKDGAEFLASNIF